MLGNSHYFVAMLSMACLNEKERRILYPRWGGIESGATLSDEFRIMWEPDTPDSKTRSLVHRYYVDSDDPKDHGCVIRALDHSAGSIDFINSYYRGELEGVYNEIEFLENLGMFLGVASHHISDLCTPPHVGHKIDFEKIGFKTLKALHSKVEKDIDRYYSSATIKLSTPKKVKLSKRYFKNIAEDTYSKSFLNLDSVYKNNDQPKRIEMVSSVISNAVKHTTDVWHTILMETNMAEKDWSYQPLL